MAMTLLWGGDDASARALKYMRAGNATPMSITLDTVKRTSPALALMVPGDGDTWYANLTAVTDITVGGLYINHNAITYAVTDNVDDMGSKFLVTTTPDTSSFSFNISAMGTFSIDWGDNTIEDIERTNTTDTTYSHTYATAGVYTIRIGGQAQGYAPDNKVVAAISFTQNQNVARIEGSLGAIFPTIGDGKTSGQQPVFALTFSYCTNLTGSIPPELFAGIFGPPKMSMFGYTFAGCERLTGEIPENLFVGIEGAPAPYMFTYTFFGCSGLTGDIPSKLFAGIKGVPVDGMFSGTFADCRGLTSIGDGLFGDISGTAQNDMFGNTFYGCSALRGSSARTTTGKYLYEIWPNATTGQVSGCYNGASGLTDYAKMPSTWK